MKHNHWFINYCLPIIWTILIIGLSAYEFWKGVMLGPQSVDGLVLGAVAVLGIGFKFVHYHLEGISTREQNERERS